MRFRLTYSGSLRAKQKDAFGNQPDPRAQHTHDIRRQFHGQLKRLWQTNRFLSETKRWFNDPGFQDQVPDGFGRLAPEPNEMIPMQEFVANRFQRDGYKFVPLVLGLWDVECDLDILFLRRDIPGSVVHAGDLDNRIKNLIDALRIPTKTELKGNELPGPGEDPFFVLLEDDKHVTGLRVETDTLLDPIAPDDRDHSHVKLVISVRIKPYNVTMLNIGFS